MPPFWFDAHCHLADLDEADRKVVLALCRARGVRGFLMGGVDPADWQRQLELAEREPGCYRSAGLHPWSVARLDESACDMALKSLENALVGATALGETGLDLAIREARESYPRQIRCFKWQIELARRTSLPLVLHVVKAHAEAIAVLKESFPSGWRGMVHDFQGGLAEARHYHAMGFLLSIGPRARGKLAVEVLHALPPQAFVIETDSPYVPGFRKKEGASRGAFPESASPARVLEVAAWIAGETGRDANEWLDISSSNLKQSFAINDDFNSR